MKQRLVTILPEAKDDLRWIYTTISDASSQVTAMVYIERLSQFLSRLEYASERGTRRDEVKPGLRIIGFENRVTIAFTVEAEQVVILRIFYGGANWEETL